MCMAVCTLSPSVVSDSCDPMDCSPPGSSVHGILLARKRDCRLPFPSLANLPTQGTDLRLLHGRQVLYHWALGRPNRQYFFLLNAWVELKKEISII